MRFKDRALDALDIVARFILSALAVLLLPIAALILLSIGFLFGENIED